MKIRINYDLIDKINESKTGFRLVKVRNDIIKFSSIFTLLDWYLNFLTNEPIDAYFWDLLDRIIFNSIIFIPVGIISAKNYKSIALHELKKLACILRSHYINTDYELLQKAYEYETNYKFTLDEDKIPRLKQEKYIMVPVVDRDGEKEVSLVQEHLIGSKDYDLSYGSPSKSKVLRPVYNGI